MEMKWKLCRYVLTAHEILSSGIQEDDRRSNKKESMLPVQRLKSECLFRVIQRYKKTKLPSHVVAEYSVARYITGSEHSPTETKSRLSMISWIFVSLKPVGLFRHICSLPEPWYSGVGSASTRQHALTFCFILSDLRGSSESVSFLLSLSDLRGLFELVSSDIFSTPS